MSKAAAPRSDAGRAHARIITRIILIRVSALTACG